MTIHCLSLTNHCLPLPFHCLSFTFSLPSLHIFTVSPRPFHCITLNFHCLQVVLLRNDELGMVVQIVLQDAADAPAAVGRAWLFPVLLGAGCPALAGDRTASAAGWGPAKPTNEQALRLFLRRAMAGGGGTSLTPKKIVYCWRFPQALQAKTDLAACRALLELTKSHRVEVLLPSSSPPRPPLLSSSSASSPSPPPPPPPPPY